MRTAIRQPSCDHDVPIAMPSVRIHSKHSMCAHTRSVEPSDGAQQSYPWGGGTKGERAACRAQRLRRQSGNSASGCSARAGTVAKAREQG